MGIKDLWQTIKKKLGIGQEQMMLEEGKEQLLDPKNEEFIKNMLNELGIDEKFSSKEPVKEILLKKIKTSAIEKGLITEEQSLNDIKTGKDALNLVNDIKKSNEISIKNGEITVWSTDVRDDKNKLKIIENFKINQDDSIYRRSISAREHMYEKGKDVTYHIYEYTYGDMWDRVTTKYDEVKETFDYSKQIKNNSEKVFEQMLYSQMPRNIEKFEKEEENDYYSVEIRERYNSELDPQKQDKEQLQINMLVEMGVPRQLLQSKIVRENCINQLGNISNLNTEKEIQERIDKIKESGAILVNDSGVLIQSKESENGHDYSTAKLYTISTDQFNRACIYNRELKVDEYINQDNQTEAQYNIQDNLIRLDSSDISQQIGGFEKTVVIFDPEQYNKTEENLKNMINLDTSKEQNQEGKTSAEKFREALKKDYQKQQQKSKEIFKGLNISEKLLEDPQTYASLQDSLLAEISRAQIDLENQDANQIVATLKDNMSWQIEKDRVLIYNNDSLNGKYSAVEYTALEEGKIQKSNLAVQEKNIEGQYGYDFTSNSTITQNGKMLKNVEKSNHEMSQNKLPKDKILISLNSLTSLPSSEWQQISESEPGLESNLNKDDEVRNA